MLADLKHALRRLTKGLGFSTFVIVTLALGIGANTAIFTLVHSIFLAALPVPEPQQLYFLTDPDHHADFFGGTRGDRAQLTYAEFRYLHDHNSVFSGLGAASSFNPAAKLALDDGTNDTSANAHVALVSGNYFAVLGVEPLLGRFFGPEVDQGRDSHPVAVLSYSLWHGSMGADPTVVGRRVRIGKTLYDVVGVASPDFEGDTAGSAPAAWVPFTMQPEILPGRDYLTEEKTPLGKEMWLQVIGRLKPEMSPVQAESITDALFQGYIREQAALVPATNHDDFLNQHIKLTAGGRGASVLRTQYQDPLTVLMILVGLLLLIACANVANLMLARASTRHKELAVRIAVGASTWRLFRQFLVESLLLAVGGGLLGLLVARWGDAILLQLAGRKLNLHPSGSVLLFTLGVSLLSGVLFGTAPALQASRVNLNAALKGTPSSGRTGLFSPRRIFVVAQVAVSLLLLITAGLFVRSLRNLGSAEFGFDHDHLLQFYADPLSAGYKPEAIAGLDQQLAERIRALPGIKAVTFCYGGLLGGYFRDWISIEGQPFSAGQEPSCEWDMVAPDYFSTVGIPILLGRAIGPQDSGRVQRVGVLNRTMAQYYFGDANPVGRRIIVHYAGPIPDYDFVVVGVAADSKYYSARDGPIRHFYVPYLNPIGGEVTSVGFEIQANGRPDALIPAIQAAIKEIAPNLTTSAGALSGIQTLNQRADKALSLDRLLSRFSGFFGLLAALLTSMGIYCSLAYMVARRTREIGIRMALGARSGDVLQLVLGDALVLVLIGIAIGGPAALLAGRLLTGFLFGISAADPLVIALSAVTMILVALAAGYWPGRRATRIDPLVALREE